MKNERDRSAKDRFFFEKKVQSGGRPENPYNENA
jgi:hypothetical protein